MLAEDFHLTSSEQVEAGSGVQLSVHVLQGIAYALRHTVGVHSTVCCVDWQSIK
jgi:hypothetical protein